MYTERKDLKVGKIYFIDNTKKTTGVFKGRDEDGIYFDCDEKSPYGRSNRIGQKHLTPFNTEGSGFEEVLIGDNLTEEDLILIEAIYSTMMVELTKEELSQLRSAIQYKLESLRRFTGRSIEADIEELMLIREKLK